MEQQLIEVAKKNAKLIFRMIFNIYIRKLAVFIEFRTAKFSKHKEPKHMNMRRTKSFSSKTRYQMVCNGLHSDLNPLKER